MANKEKQKKECPIECQPPKDVCIYSYLRDVPITESEYRKLIKKHL